MPTTPIPKRILIELEAIQKLAEQLAQEPWDEFDRTIAQACELHMKTALGKLQTCAKAIARLRTSEARADTNNERMNDWWNDALDEMT